MTFSVLPTVNALLNGTAAVLLSAGFLFIRARNMSAHRACMLAAFGVSALFLVSYLTYHIHRTYVTGLGPTRFPGQGPARTIYLTILISHTILAVTVVPLVLVTLRRALKRSFDSHRRLARWTLPVWFYVSVTGVVIYVMLYRIDWAT